MAVKSPKKPPKEPSLPTQDESRRTNVLMEQMLSKFDTFGEAQAAMRERFDRMEPDLHAVKEDVAVLKAAVQTHTQTLRGQTDAIKANTEDIRALKEVVQGHTKAIEGHTEAIQNNTEATHSMQADLKNIDRRVEVVEAKLAS